jgi:hypothetical protein
MYAIMSSLVISRKLKVHTKFKSNTSNQEVSKNKTKISYEPNGSPKISVPAIQTTLLMFTKVEHVTTDNISQESQEYEQKEWKMQQFYDINRRLHSQTEIDTLVILVCLWFIQSNWLHGLNEIQLLNCNLKKSVPIDPS